MHLSLSEALRQGHATQTQAQCLCRCLYLCVYVSICVCVSVYQGVPPYNLWCVLSLCTQDSVSHCDKASPHGHRRIEVGSLCAHASLYSSGFWLRKHCVCIHEGVMSHTCMSQVKTYEWVMWRKWMSVCGWVCVDECVWMSVCGWVCRMHDMTRSSFSSCHSVFLMLLDEQVHCLRFAEITYGRHDSFICLIWLIRMCDLSNLDVWCVTCLINKRHSVFLMHLDERAHCIWIAEI